ncbi:MAG TPA: VWA domain-containing protein [Thermoanaerobaculia bacterium]|nr:VWA domain-containing protein [Thermoanaerobaculia bacterium]
MTARRRIVAIASLLLLLTGSTTAQIPSLGETIEVAIVNVDVVVTDSDGKRVHGLTRADFEVLEDGKPQELSHFAEYRGAAARAVMTVEGEPTVERAPDQPSQRRTLVIFIEIFKLPNFRVEPFIGSIKKVVRETIHGGDSVSLVTFDGKANVLLESTSDVDLVEQHLDDVARQCIGVLHERTSLAAASAAEVREFDAAGAAMAASRGLQAASRPTADETAVHAARTHALEARLEMNRRVATINTLLKGLAGVEGKKVLLLASHRLGEYTGAEYYYAAGVENGIIPPNERADIDNRPAVREIIANANASGVTIYPVFPTGLDAGKPADPAMPDVSQYVLMNEMVTLREVAEKTGGLATYGTLESGKLLPRLAEDMSDYYSLAYRATASRVDLARKIVVRMKDRKLTARSRREFVEKSDDTDMRDRVLAMLHGAPIESSFQLQAELGAAKKVSRKTQSAPLKVRIPINALTLLPQGTKHSGAFTIYAITGGLLGEVSEVTRRTQSFDIPEKDLARANASYFTYDFDVMVNVNTKQLAVGVLDEVSKTYGFVSVPVAPKKQ